MPVIDCVRPKKRVKISTTMATQNVYHWTLFRLSFHHWWIVPGSDLSYDFLIVDSLSAQYLYFPSLRNSNWSSTSPALGSSRPGCRLCAFWYHFLQRLLDRGRRRAMVSKVSFSKSTGSTWLWCNVIMACLQGKCWYQAYSNTCPILCAWRTEMWW
jgi:hypothetical protein